MGSIYHVRAEFLKRNLTGNQAKAVFNGKLQTNKEITYIMRFTGNMHLKKGKRGERAWVISKA